MTPERRHHLILSTLRQRAVAETHMGHTDYANELDQLADELERETLHGHSVPDTSGDWLT